MSWGSVIRWPKACYQTHKSMGPLIWPLPLDTFKPATRSKTIQLNQLYVHIWLISICVSIKGVLLMTKWENHATAPSHCSEISQPILG